MSARPLSPAQQQALAWLRRVGKATRTSALAEGVRVATLDALVNRGLATRALIPSASSFGGSRLVWRPVPEEDA